MACTAPTRIPTRTPQLVTTVPYIDGAVLEMAGASRSSLGLRRHAQQTASRPTGHGGGRIGHHGQRQPARRARRDLSPAEPVGTLFLPHGSTLPAWKRWLGYTARPRGRLVVDAGARKAVQEQGRSLLPIGVVQVRGRSARGTWWRLCDPDGVEFARGLTNYSSAATDKLRGLRTEQIREVMGAFPYEEIVHRDNLVVIV